MSRPATIRRFALLLTAALGLITALFVHGLSAAAVYTARGPSKATCSLTGGQTAATFQNDYFGSELHGFIDSELIQITFAFPDGRIFSPLDTFLLDGVVDMPPHYINVYQADVAGDLYFEFPVTAKWPYGCYKLTAYGLSSTQTAVGYLVVQPRVGPGPEPSPARLAAWNNGTRDAFATHDSLVNIFGVNFLPNETVSIWITQPDGVVIDYPQQIASDAGNFESSFVFSNAYQTGKYTFTALGTVSGYQVFAPFELHSKSSTPSGWATLRVAYPFPASTSQNGEVVVSGTLFSPDEYVALWITMPNNAVRTLPSQLADGNGDFYAVLALDERLPVGEYDITAMGISSGRLVIATFNVTPGGFDGVGLLEPPAAPAPEVTVTNVGDGTLGGPTNLAGVTGGAQELTLPDTYQCSDLNAFWTPNC